MQTEPTLENLLEFVEDVQSGAIQSFLKSEEVPAVDTNPVRTIVGKNFEQVVMDHTKDVLVEFYAPWCAHCKALEPIYDELASKLSHHENLIIAKIDATQNEVNGITIRSFPTIRLWKKDEKENTIDYDGERDVQSFI